MDSLETLDFSSFIIFSDDPWSLLVSFCQLFKLPLVVQCCNVICEWPLTLIDNGVAYTTHCTGRYFAIFPKYYVAVLRLILFIIIIRIGKW